MAPSTVASTSGRAPLSRSRPKPLGTSTTICVLPLRRRRSACAADWIGGCTEKYREPLKGITTGTATSASPRSNDITYCSLSYRLKPRLQFSAKNFVRQCVRESTTMRARVTAGESPRDTGRVVQTGIKKIKIIYNNPGKQSEDQYGGDPSENVGPPFPPEIDQQPIHVSPSTCTMILLRSLSYRPLLTYTRVTPLLRLR